MGEGLPAGPSPRHLFRVARRQGRSARLAASHLLPLEPRVLSLGVVGIVLPCVLPWSHTPSDEVKVQRRQKLRCSAGGGDSELRGFSRRVFHGFPESLHREQHRAPR